MLIGYRTRDHRWGVTLWGWTIRWSWRESEWEWNRSDPWWRRFSVDLRDLFLGRMKCEVVKGETRNALVPMPEGAYPAVLTKKTRTWRRTRRPFWRKVRVEWDIQIPGGIPFMGKGEDSWDCGDDGLYGTGGSSPENAVANTVEFALRSRAKYGETEETRGRVVLARPAEAGGGGGV